MGLDNYASRSPDDIELTEEDIQAFADAQIELCGGIFSGDSGSLRGKVYAILLDGITGESLYAEWLSPHTVSEMYAALLACDPADAIDQWGSRNTVYDILELRKFFKVCSVRGLVLIGWS